MHPFKFSEERKCYYNGHRVNPELLDRVPMVTAMQRENWSQNDDLEKHTTVKLKNNSADVIAFKFRYDYHFVKPHTGCIPSRGFVNVKFKCFAKYWLFSDARHFQVKFETMVLPFDIDMPYFPSVGQLCQFNNLWEDRSFMEMMGAHISKQCVKILLTGGSDKTERFDKSDDTQTDSDSYEFIDDNDIPTTTTAPMNELVDCNPSVSSDDHVNVMEKAKVGFFNIDDYFLSQVGKAELTRRYTSQVRSSL